MQPGGTQNQPKFAKQNGDDVKLQNGKVRNIQMYYGGLPLSSEKASIMGFHIINDCKPSIRNAASKAITSASDLECDTAD